MAGAVAFETEHFGGGEPRFSTGFGRKSVWRLSLRNFAVEAVVEDNDKTDLGPLIGIADCTVVPQPGIKGARGSAKFRCANGSVQFAVVGGGNPLRAWVFLEKLGPTTPDRKHNRPGR